MFSDNLGCLACQGGIWHNELNGWRIFIFSLRNVKAKSRIHVHVYRYSFHFVILCNVIRCLLSYYHVSCCCMSLYLIAKFYDLRAMYITVQINGTFSQGMEFNELVSNFQWFKKPLTKCYVLTCCCVNVVCVSHLIVQVMPEKHARGSDFWMSSLPHIFHLFIIESIVQPYKAANIENLT